MTVQTVTYRCPHCQQPVDVDLSPGHEMLICPNEDCKKPFKVDVPKAEPISELVLPPGADEVDSARPVATAAAPANVVAKPADEVEEKTLHVVRLDMLRRYPFRCSAYLLLIVGAVIGLVVFLNTGWVVLALLSLAVGLVVAGRLVAWWLRTKNTSFTVTNKRCILESGIFSKEKVELPLTDIQDIQVSQTFVQRRLDVGDLILVNKKGETDRIVVMAVPAPEAVATTIRDERLPG